MFHTEKKLLYIFREAHLVICRRCCCCCYCRMSVQTADQEWQCPGAGSQSWLPGCQRDRERAVSQVVPPVNGLAGGRREGACLRSFHTASLNWCFQSRNVSAFGTCSVCLCFQLKSRLYSRSSPCNSPGNAKTCTYAQMHAGVIAIIKVC